MSGHRGRTRRYYRERSKRYKEKLRRYGERMNENMPGFDEGLYRSRDGVIMGVFKGLADYFDLNVRWLRVCGVILFFLTGIWPTVVLYFVAAFIMKPEPVIPLGTLDEAEFYDSYIYSRKGATNRLLRRFQNLDRRIQRMEHIVTDRDFDWEERLNS